MNQHNSVTILLIALDKNDTANKSNKSRIETLTQKIMRDGPLLKKLAQEHRINPIDAFFFREELRAVKRYCGEHTIPYIKTTDSTIDAFLQVKEYTEKNISYKNIFQQINTDEINRLNELYRQSGFEVRLV